MPVEMIIIEDQSLTDSGFVWREREGVKVLVCSELERLGFANGFSTRVGGVSPPLSGSPVSEGGELNLAGFDEDDAENIYENRRRFLGVFGGGPSLATVWQVHGDTVKTVATAYDISSSEDRADALTSDLDGVLVGVKTADCVPVLIGDARTAAFAAIHAGWRGTVLSIVKKTVTDMARVFGSDPSDLVAAIGPAACGRRYEVGQDVIDDFRDNFGTASEEYFEPTREGHALVDLHRANRDQLIAAGLRADNIYLAPFCTMERPDLFFSYRLEKRKYGRTGRLLSVIGKNVSAT